MLTLTQFRYSADNFAYVVSGPKTAIAIDPGAVDEILEFIHTQGLTLTHVINTHTHPDHTVGNAPLIQHSGATHLDVQTLMDTGRLDIDGEPLLVHHTPGHMEDCLTFEIKGHLITGDTLFNGTVGTCFSGDMESFFRAITFLLTFPDDTKIYAGHDYVQESMAFARTIEPENEAEIARYLTLYDPAHVVSTLADEKRANPFVRFNEKNLIKSMKQSGLPVATERERWNSVMELC
ncbi:MBL fold metallo-hydrolase [Desulfoluna sp.]|uniref:MBL fold metallo-hydrolase n=1 Tax=Desulfoluna sp. TaxID=2045199 RepID=UPI0026295771|nr:MBL fold metallo-hydrolase [Desulfoluna sp.]